MVDKKDKITETKERILNNLNGLLDVTNLKLDNRGRNVAIICEFVREGEKGTFRFYWGENIGIDYVRDYSEKENEDIYAEIFEWVEGHFKFKKTISLKYDGKEMIK